MSPEKSQSPPLTVVSWSSDDSGGFGELLSHDATALVGGTILVAGILIGLATVGASRLGEYRLVAFVALALFFGGPFMLVIIAVVAAGGSLRENFPTIETIRLRPFILASVLGVCAVVLAIQYPPVLAAYLFVGILTALTVSILRTAGTVDVEAASLSISSRIGRDSVLDLTDLQSVTTHRVGGVVVFRLRFVGTRGAASWPVVSVPTGRAAEVRRALEAIADSAGD
ncbi:hypothetical protein [Haloferax sp. DFSO52]|uniref:hypothetical protein n=1 Tax=Haloferax sp. DFSO52 TaxID=3388505 RepID=UPI003A8C5626